MQRYRDLASIELLMAACVVAMIVGCNREKELEERQTILTIGLPESKTSLGEPVDGKRKVYWSNGDQVSLNGVASEALSGLDEDAVSASFTFQGVINPPFNLLYPASFYKNSGTITLPATQEYAAGTFANNVAPLCGYAATAGADISLAHLGSIIHLIISKDAAVSQSSLAAVRFRGNNGEQVCGDFTIDYQAHTLTPSSSATADKTLTMSLSQPLSESAPLDIFLVVPAGTYSGGFYVELVDNLHRTMTKVKDESVTLTAGGMKKMTAFTFVPSALATSFEIEDIVEEVLEPDGFNVKGRVVDNSGNGIEGVVVSDGLQCVRTMFDGSFYMTSDIPNVKFIQISTPSGYLPAVEGGKPRFYKLLSGITPSDGIYNCGDFVLTPVANPNTYTLFITADPQPRATSLGLDNIAYRSTRCCEALYRDLQETAAPITDRQVYGICLGDLVHEDMDLMGTYATALGTLGYPTYNIMGNHDYDMSKTSDDEGAWRFEELFGPRNYSFNIGGIHFVVLDNVIMKDGGNGKIGAYDHGLTDEIWTWLQADMTFIPTSTTVMVFAHSPLFKCDNGSERTNTSKHGGHNSSEGYAYGYGTLFDSYDEVHAWGGHSHTTFNYIYPSSHRNKNIQVHTLARSTGELWTNEYLSNGTPRGFTIVEVVNGDVASWRFHPTKYLMSSFHGSHGQPAYSYCDWVYTDTSPAVAKMKDTGADLDESYQMHVFPPDAYSDGKLYVNVFLWDSLWQRPTLTMSGGSPVIMEHIEDVDVKEADRTGFDIANKEIIDFYNANYSSLLTSAGYKTHSPGLPLTMFSVDAPASGTGTVSVTDRFGNTYSRTVSW
ncbi:MAG: calcineurin-like phosphoesterase C-terminal domain-containing protein [Bacteroidales bacterium]|nr:calcineurin-like phosphoesterase C-terminal domain-containing protein [Bacteroidales bacterium]